jgi:porin
MERKLLSFGRVLALSSLLAAIALAGPALAQNVPTQPTATDTTTEAPAAATPAPAPAEPAATPATGLGSLLTAKYLTGDWGGVRNDLVDSGIELRLTYQQQYMVNMRGGLETTNGNDFAGSYDLGLLLDFGRMKLIPGGSFYIKAKGTYGGEASDFDDEKIGGLFATNDDASAERPIYVATWHYRQRLLNDRIEFRVGQLDSSATFDASEYAGSEDEQFMNTVLGSTANVPHKVGLGAYVNVWPADWLYVRAAAIDHQHRTGRTGFDTAFHDEAWYRVFFETGILPQFIPGSGMLPGSYRAGLWYVPGARPVFFDDLGGRLAARTRGDDVGFYIGLDQLVWKENADPKDEQGLGVFAKYGYAHGDINLLEHVWSTGFQYQGLIPARDNDVLGFGVGQGIVSRDFRNELNGRADRETVYELYYAIEIFPWLVFTPDMQLVTNPGGTKDGRDAWVAGFRFRVNF